MTLEPTYVNVRRDDKIVAKIEILVPAFGESLRRMVEGHSGLLGAVETLLAAADRNRKFARMHRAEIHLVVSAFWNSTGRVPAYLGNGDKS